MAVVVAHRAPRRGRRVFAAIDAPLDLPRLAQQAGGDEQTLRAQVAANPAELATRLLLGQVLAAAQKYEQALAEYLDIVRRNRNFEGCTARKAMLDIFELLGPEHELTGRYRSELAKVSFS